MGADPNVLQTDRDPDRQPHEPILTANGHLVDAAPDALGDLEPVDIGLDDAVGLQRLLRERGYLYFRRLVDPELVAAARREILLKYAIIGEIDDRFPIDDAIAGDGGGVRVANLRAFSESVRTGTSYLAVTEHPAVLSVHRALLGGEVRSFDMRWPRFVRPGEGCGYHCDGPYMNRGTDTSRIVTSWIPLGRVLRHEGALMLLEGSHRNDALSGYLSADADRDGLQWLDADPSAVRARYGGRWLTTDFEAGDVLCFGMNMLHGALDNRSPVGRCRLSSDSRYQRIDEPADPRWNGSAFEGHGGRRVFYPGLGHWNNEDFQDEWKNIDEFGRLRLRSPSSEADIGGGHR